MKVLRVTAILLVSVLILAACQEDEETGGGEREFERLGRGGEAMQAENIKIGLSTQDAENQYWIELADEFEEAANEVGAEVVFDAKYDPDGQAKIVENFLAQDVDAIAVSPVDPRAIQPVFESAMDQDVLVVNNHFPTDPEFHDVFVDTGPYESGFIAGSWAADYINENMGGKADVAILTLPENETLTTRVQGIIDAVEQKAQDASIVAKQRAQSQEDAVNVTENILTANPNTKVWLGWSDFVMLGTVAGLEGQGENPGDHAIVGIDATCDAVKAMQDGKMDASVDNPPRPFARLVFNIILSKLTDENSPWNFVTHAITRLEAVDESNLPQFVERCDL